MWCLEAIMETARVVEVLHDRGESMSPRWLLGSGFVVRDDVVITAAHNICGAVPLQPSCTVVRTLDGVEYTASLLVRSDLLDLALLAVPTLQGSPAKIGRIDRGRIEVIRDAMTAGFPNYKYSNDRPIAQKRQPAQPVGSIPTAEGYSAGNLTLKVEAGIPAQPLAQGASPWEGLSGAGVVADEYLVGVVVEHHLAEGLGSLTLVPLARVLDIAGVDGALFRAILGIGDLEEIEIIGVSNPEDGDDPILIGIIKDLKEVMTLGRAGLLSPSEVSALKLTAYKEAKGWR
jgi:hypothetical protein